MYSILSWAVFFPNTEYFSFKSSQPSLDLSTMGFNLASISKKVLFNAAVFFKSKNYAHKFSDGSRHILFFLQNKNFFNFFNSSLIFFKSNYYLPTRLFHQNQHKISFYNEFNFFFDSLFIHKSLFGMLRLVRGVLILLTLLNIKV